MIEAILPADVSAADTFHELPDEQLFPQEEAAVVKAVDKRQREFRTVRGCARIALAQLGLPRPVLVPGASGAVSWPGGIVGSMTHCAGYRAAAVARVVNVLGLGVDAEPHAALPVGVLDSVALPGEQAHLAELRRTAGGVCWDRLLFSGKESVYKAWFPLTGRWLGFEDALVTIDPVRGTFTAHLQVAGPDVEGRELTDFHGRWLVRDGLVLTAVIVRHTPTSGPDRAQKQRRDVLIRTVDPSTPLTDTSQRGPR
jgi:4'-phosphopantetheinyl transferase EntD